MIWSSIRRAGVILYNTAPADAGGKPGGGSTPEKATTRRDVEAFVARHGSAERAVAVLMDDNFGLRKYRRMAKGKASPDELREMLPDGYSLVPKADADELVSFRALGKLDQVRQRMTDAEKLQGELAKRDRDASLREAAETAEYNPAVFAKLAESEKLHVEIREETVDGKSVKKALVRKADKPNDPLVALAEFAEKQLTEFLPALKAGSTTPAPTTVFPQQRTAPTGAQNTGNLVDAHLAKKAESAKKGTNPLMQAQTT